MSWTQTDRDGRVMWERCDGTVLPSTDRVQALEDYERAQSERQREYYILKDTYLNPDPINYDDAPASKTEMILAAIIAIAGIATYIYGVIK